MKIKKISIYALALILQALMLAFPSAYSWQTVVGLSVFLATYCFELWLNNCSKKESDSVVGRMTKIEDEIKALNQLSQWRK